VQNIKHTNIYSFLGVNMLFINTW